MHNQVLIAYHKTNFDFNKFMIDFAKGPSGEDQEIYKIAEISKLPFDVMRKIFLILTLSDLGKVPRTCKTWNTIVNNERFLADFQLTLINPNESLKVACKIERIKNGAKFIESFQPDREKIALQLRVPIESLFSINLD